MLRSIIAPYQLTLMQDLASQVPAGAFCEIGVFNGGSAAILYGICLIQGRELHLFDTFTGTPFYTEDVDRHRIDSEFAAPNAEENIRLALPLAKLHVGIYPNTHPAGLKDIAFIHCDCDQYLSYRAVIDVMWPLVVPGGIMLFDDYPYLAGAKKAVEESFSPGELRPIGQRFFVLKV